MTTITLDQIINKTREIEERNDQSIIFTLNEDGSGTFEDFWNNKPVVSFESLADLEKILNERNSVDEVIPVCECDKGMGIYSDNGKRIRCCKCGGIVEQTG